ncbi:MAG: DUF302 domain-containing protein [Candidatus Cloacimonadaceae bacterium]|jgi:uncharacterized protein (DUF302 family)|nr:DUF302 domain-containing protein [Candidatus Cloacimonadota bacterium]MDY0127434.1 DUF302 domain-containing protein [Candidatus Cloacimonadaceae bacterium]MCB5254573.1 DUF302 domain-containing protein [Candidatus Cloacimonadota bacterium]MCK9178757.1 DUF302 domain-containing protein [Candidatus Cloacimonadota bacterium]MCK9242477.1 DUF302 domain-containing protein [Candidatus Cloacimonadota bacterium]
MDKILITQSTDKSFGATIEALKAAVVANKFGVVHVHDLQQLMQDKGLVFERKCKVMEVCNPHTAQRVLGIDMGVSSFLPCRISVYEEGGKTIMATLKPSIVLATFDAKDIPAIALEVEATLIRIMQEAAAT